MTKEIGDLDDVLQLTLNASQFYKEHGYPDSAILLLNKSADILQTSDPKSSVRLLKEACNICQVRLDIFIFTSDNLIKSFVSNDF